MLRTPVLALSLLFGASTLLAAQKERWQVALDDHRYVWDVELLRLDGDSLVLKQSDTLVRVPVAHVDEIRLIRSTEVQAEADGGAGAMSALMGGDDEVYDLKPLPFADRLEMLQKILLYHPTSP